MKSFKLKTPRGVEVDVLASFVDSWAGSGKKVPAIVIAPGQHYHMELPIIEQLAEKAIGLGFAVIRFNWSFFTADTEDGKPSQDLKLEAEELQSVLDFVRSENSVDSSRIFLVGKSLGSLVSNFVFFKNPDLMALCLITPIFTWFWDDQGEFLQAPIPVGAKYYPGLAEATKPIVLIAANTDPVCSLPMMYDFLKNTKGNISVVVVGGDHDCKIGAFDDSQYAELNKANVCQIVESIAHWIQMSLRDDFKDDFD